MTFRLLTRILLLSLTLALFGCKKDEDDDGADNPTPTESVITTDAATTLLETSLQAGTIRYTQAGAALDGFQINIPEGALPSSASFRIQSAPITGHKLGRFFTPVTPLITIESDAADARAPMQIQIPVTIPEGSFAMGFYFL